MKTLSLMLAAFLLFISSASVAQTCDNVLLAEVDKVRSPQRSFSFKVSASVTGGSNVTLQATVKDQSRTLIRYLAPITSKGRSLLFVDENMWVYVPGTRRAIRISPQQRVIGGVASADVARLVFSVDYDVQSCEQITTDIGADFRMTLAPKTGGLGTYRHIDLDIEKARSRPLRAIFYAKGDRKLKDVFYEDYREILDAQRPTRLRVMSHTGKGEETIILYSDFAFANPPTSWFQPNYLTRLK